MKEILNTGLSVTAVFTMSDVQAIGAIRAALDKGLRVPEDISVIGFDGLTVGGYCNPKLTTILQQVDKLAEMGTELLLHQISGPIQADRRIVPFVLTERDSVQARSIK